MNRRSNLMSIDLQQQTLTVSSALQRTFVSQTKIRADLKAVYRHALVDLTKHSSLTNEMYVAQIYIQASLLSVKPPGSSTLS